MCVSLQEFANNHIEFIWSLKVQTVAGIAKLIVSVREDKPDEVMYCFYKKKNEFQVRNQLTLLI